MTLNTKRMPWYTNSGEVAFKTCDSFTVAAEKAIKPRRIAEGPEHHMRVGDFAVVVFVERDVIAAPIYSDNGAAMYMPRTSEFWQKHVANRTHQIELIERALEPTHPHYAEIKKACEQERASFV